MQPATAFTTRASSFAYSYPHPLARVKSQDDEAARRGATATERHIYLALGLYQNEHGGAYPGLAELVARTGRSDRTVRDALVRLRALGLFEIEELPTPRSVTKYRLILPPIPERKQSGSRHHSGWQPPPPKSPEKKEENKNACVPACVAPGVPTPAVPVVDLEPGSLSPAVVSVSPPAPWSPTLPSAPVQFETQTLPKAAASSGPTAPIAPLPLAPPARVATPSPDPAPIQTRRQYREANQAAYAKGLAAWEEHVRTRSRPGGKLASREPYKPYQLPLPKGPLISEMPQAEREAFLKASRAKFDQTVLNFRLSPNRPAPS